MKSANLHLKTHAVGRLCRAALPVRVAVALVFFGLCHSGWSKAEEPGNTRLFFDAVCVQPVAGQPWTIRVTGSISSLAGCFLVAHDDEERLVGRWLIPHGVYSQDRAFEIPVPASPSGRPCRIVVIGNQQDLLGIDLPMTSLKKEVYYSSSGLFAASKAPPFWMTLAPESRVLKFIGTSGVLHVRDGESALLQMDVLTTGHYAGSAMKGEALLDPAKVYQLDASSTFYFQITPPVYLSFDRERAFFPGKLVAVPWWRLAASGLTSSANSAGKIPTVGAESKD